MMLAYRRCQCQIQASHPQTTQPDVAFGLNHYRNSENQKGSIYHSPSKSAPGVPDELGIF